MPHFLVSLSMISLSNFEWVREAYQLLETSWGLSNANSLSRGTPGAIVTLV
jgi:hypothetical protein